MRQLKTILALATTALLIASCGQKKQTDDIITTKPEEVKPTGPVRMQDYQQTKDIVWLGRNYQVDIRRTADDSLSRVKDETGQQFIDNRVSLRILRSDGSVFFARSFTKAAFDAQLNDDYRRTGILEGFVFDRVDGNNLIFAASVSHPKDDDEYIPMVVTVTNEGEVSIKLDGDMDTNGGGSVRDNDEDDGV